MTMDRLQDNDIHELLADSMISRFRSMGDPNGYDLRQKANETAREFVQAHGSVQATGRRQRDIRGVIRSGLSGRVVSTPEGRTWQEVVETTAARTGMHEPKSV